MAMPNGGDGPWPVAVRYSWGGGADLQARTVDGDGKVLRAGTALANAELDHRAWDELPVRDANGNRIEYWIDGPGDNRVSHGLSDWRRRWHAAADRTPTQYAHVFWLNRARGELVIQYWFFYPFNEWLNHHEGDWEHVNVVRVRSFARRARARLRLPRASDTSYYFHGRRLETDRPMQVADHPVVFVGGRARACSWWSGEQSGGSYPWPASYPGGGGGIGPLAVGDDTRGPVRIMPADSFDVVMLPEPSRLDARARPELSWLRLPFFAGQPSVFGNPPLVESVRRREAAAAAGAPGRLEFDRLPTAVVRNPRRGVGIFPMAFLVSHP